MKRLVVLGLAFIIMFGLRGMSSDSEASLTLAAIGFVVLAAFTVGELGARLGLPKVTGYIVAGVALGPQVGDILSTDMVGDMRVFNTLALGLIATSAGLELDLKAIRRVWKVLTAVVVLKVPLLILVVGGTFVAVETMLPSLNLPPEAVLPVALVVAVLGIGTSPAIALAVVNDGRAKGRLTDLLLAIAVVKDLVVVVCLAIALALAKAMLDPTAHLDAHVLIHVAEELGSSMFVGAILGGLLIAYMRFVRKQMLLMTVLMILVIAELSSTLHLELLLVFIMAGFLVRNFSPYEHDLLEPIERIALPVFVVFFTTAGAGVDLIGTFGLLPLAISLVLARIAAFYIAGRLGGAIGGEGPTVISNAWLTWIPQAGVTLGLVFLAAEALPGLAEPMTAIGMALVAIHLLVGPITLGMGLSRAGEMGAGAEVPAPHSAVHAGPGTSHEDVLSIEGTEELTLEPTAEVELVPVRTIQDVLAAVPDEVATQLRALAAVLDQEGTRLVATAEQDFVAVGRDAEARVHMSGTVEERLDRLSDEFSTDEGVWLLQMEDFVARWMGHVQALPEAIMLQPLVAAPEAHEARESSSSSLVRLQARLRRLTAGSARNQPPLRMVAREAMEHGLAQAAGQVAGSRGVLLGRLYEKLGAARLNEREAPNIEALVASWRSKTEVLLRTAVVGSIVDLVTELEEYTSPLGRPITPHYSRVESEVREALVDMRSDAPRWDRAVAASADQLRLTALVAALHERMEGLHQDWGIAALDDIEGVVLGAVDVAVEQVESMRGDADVDEESADWTARMKAVFPLKSRIGVRMAAQAFRQRVQPDRLTNTLVGLFERLPESLQRTATKVSRLKDPRELTTESYLARKQFRTLLLDERVPELCRTMDMLVPQLESAHIHIAEGVEVAAYGLTVAQREASDGPAASESLQRSAEWLRDYRTAVVDAIQACRVGLEEERNHTESDLRNMLVPKTGVSRVQSNVAEVAILLRARIGRAGRTLARGFGLTATFLEQSLDDPRLRDRSVRMGVTQLDGQAMRAVLMPMRQSGLPKAVEAMFSMRPVDDRRQFIARRDVFERLQQHLAQPDTDAPLLALVSGQRSSGRTSLANVLQLSARRLKVVRPEEVYHDRATGVLAALAKEIQCTEGLLEATLVSERTLVILDNLERFLLPTPEGLRDLAALLRLASSTAASGTQWLMTVESDALARLDELMSVSGMFNQHVRLGPVSWNELEAVLRGRARLGGFEVKAELVGTRLQRLQWAPDELWFQGLERVCEGSLGGAIAAWRSEVEVSTDRVLRSEKVGRRNIPFFNQLSVRGRAVAGTLHTWGPMTIAEMSVVTGIPGAELSGHLQVLCTTGLVRSDAFFEVDPALLQPLHHELVNAHLCRGGAQ